MYDGLMSYALLEQKVKIWLWWITNKNLVAGFIPFSFMKELYFLLTV
jgi:hypothetical protein